MLKSSAIKFDLRQSFTNYLSYIFILKVCFNANFPFLFKLSCLFKFVPQTISNKSIYQIMTIWVIVNE